MDYFSILFHKKYDSAVPFDGKYYEALFAASSGGGWSETTITGTTPIYFKSNGDPLEDYHIFGETVQNGTPSPDYPVDVQGVGEWDATVQQYKIPVTIGNVTTPIYIGTVQTTRKIKKLVLTGSESYTYQSQYSRYVFTVRNAFADGTRLTQCFCTHYRSVHNGEPIDDIPDKSIYINYQALGTQFCIKHEGLTSIADFKSYLAAQYANGTPVTLWYILASEETVIVNEPLHRIGDYADAISMTQAGASIPTVAGVNTLAVGTTVKPSAIAITGHIKPTGYGQLLDVNDVDIQDSAGEPIYIHG